MNELKRYLAIVVGAALSSPYVVLAGTTYVDNVVITNALTQNGPDATNWYYGPVVLKRTGDVLMGNYTNGPSVADRLSVVSLSAGNVTPNSATLRGELLDVGGENPLVLCYWGTNDGGQVKGSWSTGLSFGVCSPYVLTTNFQGLAADTTYYYRHYASNSLNQTWTSTSIVFSTSDPFGYSVLWWDFANTNNPVVDSSAMGSSTGTLGAGANCPTWIPETAYTSSCYYFDGTDYINAGDKQEFSFGNGITDFPFTVTGWIKPVSNLNWRPFVTKAPSGAYEWDTYGYTGGIRVFVLYSFNYGGSNALEVRTLSPIPLNSWTFLAHTYNGSTRSGGLNIYTNGCKAGLSTNSTGNYLCMSNPVGKSVSTVLSIGGAAYSGQGMAGSIDDVRIFSNELSQAQVWALYNATTNTHPSQ